MLKHYGQETVTVTGKQPDSAGVTIPPPLIYVMGLILGYCLGLVLPVAFLPFTPSLILGAVILLAGLGFAFYAIRTFRRHNTTTIPTRPATALVLDGPFRFTRNPMYLALGICYAGLALMMDSLLSLLLLIPVILTVNFYVIAKEEEYLTRKFGDEYRSYMAKVRRWI